MKMLKNGRNPEAFSGLFNGCSCCNTPNTRRAGKKRAKRKEERQWRRENNA